MDVVVDQVSRPGRGIHTHVEGRARFALRTVWAGLALLTLGVFVAAIPARLEQLLTITPTGDDALALLAPTEAAVLAAHGIPVLAYALYFITVESLFAAVFAVMGLTLFLRRSDDWWAAFMSLALIAFGVLVPATPRVLDNPASPWQLPVHIIQNLGWVSFVTCLYLFPDGRFIPRVTRFLPLAFLAWAMIWLIFPWANPFNWPLWLALLGFLGLFITGAGAQLYRYRYVSTPTQRLQTKWVVFSFALATVGILAFVAPLMLFPATREPGEARILYHVLGVPVFALSLLMIPLGLDIAIRRQRLWEIDPLINRALVYGALTVTLLLTYFAAVIILQQVLRLLTGQVSDLAIIISTLAIAALFNPLRERIQRIIAKRFYRSKYNAAQVLAGFGATVRDEVDLARLTDQLLAVVEETMQPAHVSLWLDPIHATPSDSTSGDAVTDKARR